MSRPRVTGRSGGSFLLQSGAELLVEGTIDTRGGGSRTGGISPVNLNFESRGGDGSAGFYRVEAAGRSAVLSTGNFPPFQAAQNQGPLADRDDLSGSAWLWRGTGLVQPPNWLRHILTVDIDGLGTIRTYTGDPAVPNNSGPANDPLAPLRLQFQGARIARPRGRPRMTPSGHGVTSSTATRVRC